MAIPNDRRVGRIRLKLARAITEAFPELKTPHMLDGGKGKGLLWVVDPFSLNPQIPIYASPMYDCCSWDANFAKKGGGSVHVYSWDTIGELVKRGFDVTREGNEIELSAK